MEIAPGGRAALQKGLSRPPSRGARFAKSVLALALCFGKCRCNPAKLPQNPPDVAESEASIKILDEIENIAPCLALRIPPSFAFVGDDKDFALGAPVFEAALCAFLAVEPPGRRLAFEHRGAVYGAAKLFYFWVVSRHLPALSSSERAGRPAGLAFAFPCLIRRPAARRAGRKGARHAREHERQPLAGAAGASGSQIFFSFCFNLLFCELALREQEILRGECQMRLVCCGNCAK